MINIKIEVIHARISEEKKDDVDKLSYIINSVDGNEPPVEAKKLIHLYSLGYICDSYIML